MKLFVASIFVASIYCLNVFASAGDGDGTYYAVASSSGYGSVSCGDSPQLGVFLNWVPAAPGTYEVYAQLVATGSIPEYGIILTGDGPSAGAVSTPAVPWCNVAPPTESYYKIQVNLGVDVLTTATPVSLSYEQNGLLRSITITPQK